MANTKNEAFLPGLTALDLMNKKGYICGMFLGELGVDVIKKVREYQGKKHPYAAPYRVYRFKGEDEWSTVAVFTEEGWRASSKLTLSG